MTTPPDPLILHIETAEQGCSVAISRGTELVYLSIEESSYQQTARLPFILSNVLNASKCSWKHLDAIAICDGPGSYTALRVGTSMAKAICFAHDIALIAVPTLEMIEQSIGVDRTPEWICIPTIDARRGRVFYAIYDADGTCVQPPALDVIPNVLDQVPGDQWIIGGTGLRNQPEAWTHTTKKIRPDYSRYTATHMLLPALRRYKYGHFEDQRTYTPNYLLQPHITTPKK